MFNSVFVLDETVYASPYSQTGDDFMDGAIPVCGSFSTISFPRLGQLLTHILQTSNAILYSSSFGWTEYKRWSLRRLYSLEYRLQQAVGQYACNAILMTLQVLPLVKITPF